ncbi:hypothetical protein [Nocardiopsis sp. NPDC055824]
MASWIKNSAIGNGDPKRVAEALAAAAEAGAEHGDFVFGDGVVIEDGVVIDPGTPRR